MWIYLLNVLTIPIYNRLIKNRKLFIIIVGLQLFLILALRSTVLGVDLPNYEGGYEFIRGLDNNDLWSRLNGFGMADLVYPFNYESGYTLFNWIFSHLGLNFHGFLVVCALINIISISWFIYEYSKKPWLSFVIFSTFGFFAYDFGIIRQSLALSMVLLSYILIDKKNRIAGIISFLIALSIHRTAIIALPLLFVCHIKLITRKKFLILLLLTIPILLLSGLLYNGFIVDVMSHLGKGYVGHDIIINNLMLLLFIIALLVMIFCNFSKLKEKVDSVACYALVFSIYFMIFGLYNDVLARAVEYYSIFLVILIPMVIEQYKSQKASLIIEIGVYMLLIGFMYFSIKGSVIDPYILYSGGLLW